MGRTATVVLAAFLAAVLAGAAGWLFAPAIIRRVQGYTLPAADTRMF